MAFFNGRSNDRGGARPPRQFDRSGGPQRSFGGNRGGFGGGRPPMGDREMHDATCNECGAECQVPFRPNGRKPVLCTNCFKRDESPRFDAAPRPSLEKRSFADAPKPRANEDYAQLKTQIEMMQSKLDRIIKLVSPVAVIEAVEDVPHVKRKSVKKTK